MEFWGVEVKSGQSYDVILGEDEVLHLSQACLGEIKKETKESINLHITVNDKKLVLGTLNPERLPQQLFDLVFDKDFQISHNWKHGSVYFYGYKAEQPSDDHNGSEYSESESEEEELPVPVPAPNGKTEAKKEEKAVVAGKKDGNAAGKQKVKIVEPVKGVDDKDSDNDSDDSDAMSEDSDDDEDNGDDDSSASDDEEDSSEEEETPTPKKQSGKKRANESASKTPSTEKKAKNTATPQKTEGKKGGAVHIATPHPSKQAVAKTPAGGSKSNQKSPASAADGAHSCKACNRNFKTEGALSSHNQAKHTSK